LRLHAARRIRLLAWPDTTGRRHRRANRPFGVLVVVAADDLLAPHDGQTLLAGDGLELHQRLRDGLELLSVGRQDLPRLLLALGDDAADLLIDEPRRLLGHVLALGDGVAEEDLLLVVVVPQRPQDLAHAPLGHHAAGQIGRLHDVARRASVQVLLAVDDLLGNAATEAHGDLGLTPLL